LNYY
jgi:hypothetical protein